MGEKTKIQWTDHTFNPWRGCDKVSAGCANCYAWLGAKRNPAIFGVWGPDGTRVVASEAMRLEPGKWDRAARAAGGRRRVFCASVADVFEDWRGPMVDAKRRRLHVAPSGRWCPEGLGSPISSPGWRPLHIDDVRRRLARTIWATPSLDWLLLTKRPENAGDMTYRMWFPDAKWPRNYWLGTTVEDPGAKARIDVLREVPAPVRFLSCEPLLADLGRLDLRDIDWVIVGGESGPGARPFDFDWARSVIEQCRAAGVACFLKQLGSNPVGDGSPLRLNDHKGGDPDEWPGVLRVREFPVPTKEAIDAQA